MLMMLLLYHDCHMQWPEQRIRGRGVISDLILWAHIRVSGTRQAGMAVVSVVVVVFESMAVVRSICSWSCQQ
jgi:hypothetical protein